MYQVIGVQRAGKDVVIATTSKAGEALTHYRAAQNLPFSLIRVLSPEGAEIDGFELSRRHELEEAERYL